MPDNLLSCNHDRIKGNQKKPIIFSQCPNIVNLFDAHIR